MHQQGATGSRIFVPPYAEPVSPNLDPIAHESGNALGLEIGKYLTANGFKGVQHSMGTQNSYGIMYSADVATYGSWRGSSLLLTEVASQRDLAYPFSNGNPLGPQGRSMDVPDPYRGTTWTLAQANEYAKAGLFYGVRSIARNGQDWLLNSLYKTTSNTLNWQDAPYAYVLPAGQRDPYAVYEILRTMELGKVEIDRATAPFTAGGKNYAAGSYVLRTQQPIGRWVNQLLDDATYPTWAKPCASCPLTMPYSEFTDRIPLLFGITADPIEAVVHGARPSAWRRSRRRRCCCRSRRRRRAPTSSRRAPTASPSCSATCRSGTCRRSAPAPRSTRAGVSTRPAR